MSFNDALNTFYLRVYDVGHTIKDHPDSERGHPLHGLLFPISSKGFLIGTISETGQHIPTTEPTMSIRCSTKELHLAPSSVSPPGICVCLYMSLCVYICICVCLYVCMYLCVCMYLLIYVCIYVCIWVYAHCLPFKTKISWRTSGQLTLKTEYLPTLK